MNKELPTMVGNGLTYILAAIQQNEILQIIEFIFSAILTIVILIYRIWHWWKEAKKDGKITEEELDELGGIVEDTKNGGEKK